MMLSSSEAQLSAENPPLKRKNKVLDNESYRFPVGFKQPKLEAIRQFPRACGALAPRINQKESKISVYTGRDRCLKENVTRPDNQAQLQIPAVPKSCRPPKSPKVHALKMVLPVGIHNAFNSPAEQGISAFRKSNGNEKRSLEHARSRGDGKHMIGSKKVRTGDTGNFNSRAEGKISKDNGDKTNSESVMGSSCRSQPPLIILDCPEITNGRSSATSPRVEVEVSGASKKLHIISSIRNTKNADSSEETVLTEDNACFDFIQSISEMHTKSKRKTSDGAGPEVKVEVRGVGDSGNLHNLSFGNSTNGKSNPLLREADALPDVEHSLPKINSTLKENTSKVPKPEKEVELQLESPHAKKKADTVSTQDQSADPTRRKMMETLDMFRDTCVKILHEQQVTKKATHSVALYHEAAMLLKKLGKWVNVNQHFIGTVPGVEIGDQFHFRAELVVIGLHHEFMRGIATVKRNGQKVATSVVASGRYANDVVSSDVLIYSGQGGNPALGDKRPGDQKLLGGNLALRNSMLAKNPVRVIYGFSDSEANYFDGKCNKKNLTVYIYNGLYNVNRFWQERGQLGKLVYKFELQRMAGQARVNHGYKVRLQKAGKSRGSKAHNCVCVNDISRGKEYKVIPAVNTLDRDKPPSFDYVTNITYPKWLSLPTATGCSCVDGCSNLDKCVCAAKNGGDFPFNNKGAISGARLPAVYECGPSCKCPPSCPNRVSQHGIRIPLEIFKTESKGWGVRSHSYIPIGSFICEYVGEVISDREAEKRVDNDDYLFDIGRDLGDHDHKVEFLPPHLHPMDDGCFTLDAALIGNVGRFINHSCLPNLYAQNVLFDHEDKRLPHVMLFATKNIAPMRELTCDYHYMLDQVRDKNGNLKKMLCYCKSEECKGWLY